MYVSLKKFLATTLVSTLVLVPISTVGLVLTTDAAFAKSNKSNQNSKKPKRVKHSKPSQLQDRGALASELKNLNAAHSLKNGQGYLNAGANSNIGQIATYGFAEYALGEAQEEFDLLYGELDAALKYALKYIDDCEKLPDFDCDPDIKAASQDIIAANEDQVKAYNSASSILDAEILTFDEAAGALELDDLSSLAMEYFNTLLSYDIFSTADEGTGGVLVSGDAIPLGDTFNF